MGSQTPQGCDSRFAARAVRPDAVEPARDDARRGGLSHPAHAGQHEGMGDAPGGKGVGQGAHQRFLPDQAGEIGGTVFARQYAVGLSGRGGFCHGRTIASDPPKGAAFAQDFWGKVEAGDPQQIRYGCFVPDLTRLASAAPADFRAGI